MGLKVEGRPHPIKHSRQSQLDTEVVCDHCSLRHAIYGVFAYCPDCGRHKSRQILDKNLELAAKQLDLAASIEGELSAHLVADALENVVSASDGFGREICRVHATKATNTTKAQEISLQNLSAAHKNARPFSASSFPPHLMSRNGRRPVVASRSGICSRIAWGSSMKNT